MKLRTFVALLILATAVIGIGAFTNTMDGDPTAWYWTGGTKDTALAWAREVEDYLDGTTAVSGMQITEPVLKVALENDITGADTLTAAQSGKYLFYADGNTVTLPPATGSGVIFYIIDANATAAADLTVDPYSGDNINGDTAGNYIQNQTDADGCMAILIDVDANDWKAIYTPSAWAEE